MATERFFTETRAQSLAKAAITSKYFWSWAKIVGPRCAKHGSNIAYIDLFAGPGRYDDGTISTPLMVLKTAIDTPELHDILVTVFNDKDTVFASRLRKEISALPGIESLRFNPQVCCEQVGSGIVACFEQLRMVPTLMFVDPWGYKGLSLRLVQAVLKDWGCDCIFFFNYNRVNMGLSNPLVVEHMEALFGSERVRSLSATLPSLSPSDRELTVMEELVATHKDHGATYVLPFRFRNEQGTRTSHFLVFATKNFTAYHIMKEIMARESTSSAEGVPSFEYCVADKRFPALFALNAPLTSLADSLLQSFKGQTLSLERIYRIHSPGTPYVKSNYKQILKRLEKEGTIVATPSMESRRRDTMADSVEVSFPE